MTRKDAFQILNRFRSLSRELVGRIQGFLKESDHLRLGFDRFFELMKIVSIVFRKIKILPFGGR